MKTSFPATSYISRRYSTNPITYTQMLLFGLKKTPRIYLSKTNRTCLIAVDWSLMAYQWKHFLEIVHLKNAILSAKNSDVHASMEERSYLKVIYLWRQTAFLLTRHLIPRFYWRRFLLRHQKIMLLPDSVCEMLTSKCYYLEQTQ